MVDFYLVRVVVESVFDFGDADCLQLGFSQTLQRWCRALPWEEVTLGHFSTLYLFNTMSQQLRLLLIHFFCLSNHLFFHLSIGGRFFSFLTHGLSQFHHYFLLVVQLLLLLVGLLELCVGLGLVVRFWWEGAVGCSLLVFGRLRQSLFGLLRSFWNHKKLFFTALGTHF